MGVPGGGGLHGFHVIRAEGLKLVRWGGGYTWTGGSFMDLIISSSINSRSPTHSTPSSTRIRFAIWVDGLHG